MEHVATLFKLPKIEKTRETERGSYLAYFMNEINKERIGTIYKPITIKRVALMLSKVPTQDMYAIKKEAIRYKESGKSVGQFLFGATKNK